MAIRLSIFACAVLWLTGSGLPAEAGQRWHREHGHWGATHEAVYELEHDIALLEADPAVDDGYKAPVIAHDMPRSGACAPRFPRRAGAGRLLLLQPKADLHSVRAPTRQDPKGLVLPQDLLRWLSVGSR